MSNVISFCSVRSARWKDALVLYSRSGDTAIVETKTGLICAEKITCRSAFAEIINAFGDYHIVDYADIRSVRPSAASQTSVVNAHGDWAPIHETVTAARSASAVSESAVLAFPRRSIRS